MANPNRGRRGQRWEALKVEVYARGDVCCRCGQPIDYTRPYRDPFTGEADPESKSVDHFPFPLSTHPHLAESLDNLAAAHLRCNQSASNKGAQQDTSIGSPSEEW